MSDPHTDDGRLEAIADIVRLTPQPALLRRLDGTIMASNAAMCEVLRMASENDIVGLNVFDILDKHAADRFRASDAQQILTGTVNSMEWMFDDGRQIRRVYTFKYPVFDGRGNVIAIMAISSPIEGRRKLELVWLHRISRSAADDLWILDEELSVLDCSLCRGGSRSDSLISCFFPDILEDEDLFRTVVAEARATPGKPVFVERIAVSGEAVEMDVAWLPDAFYGTRIYVASRSLRSHPSEVLERMRQAYHVESDAELSRAMGVSTGAVAQWRGKGAVPCDRLIQCYTENRVHVHWLLTGKGPQHVD